MSTELTPLQRAFMALEDTRARLAQAEARPHEPIAIVGMGCRFPAGANSPDTYWALLHEGRDGVRTVPPERWNHAPFLDKTGETPGTTYAEHAGFIDQAADEFDAAFFGISPREAAAMDPQQRLLLEVAWEALEHAGIAPDSLAGSATGVYVGIPAGDFLQLQQRGGTLADIDGHWASGFAHSIASGRLSYLLDLQGPSISLDTACSSSLVAVHQACQSLRTRECDLALAGGVNLILSPESFVGFARTHMLAADGRCKVFDATADGFVRGEGCGMVVLKRLSDARRDGNRVLAVIRGSAINQDGASASLTAPSGPAQEAVIRRALQQAQLTPLDVQFVEAHGTGTSLGDPIELRALGTVYGVPRAEGAELVVGSVKANFGHLEGAAGIAALIKLVLSLDAARVPGQLHVTQPTPHVDWTGMHLRLPASGGEAWPRTDGPRRGGVSSFGFSGTNVHLVVESAPDGAAPELTAAVRGPHIIPLAARTPAATMLLAASYANALELGTPLAALAQTAAAGRAQLPGARATVVSSDVAGAVDALRAIARGEQITMRPPSAPKAAFLFTGQGSQSPGMGRELFDTSAMFREALTEHARVVDAIWASVSLLDVLYGPDSATLLTDARYVQPAIVALELALAALWRSWGVEPAVVAGHSLGEYAAAAFAGAMSSTDALRLAAERGRLMSALPPQQSAMTSIPTEWTIVRDTLGDIIGADVELAANNGASQTVLTGTATAIERAETVVRERLRLEPHRLVATTNAFHSKFVEPMLDAFESFARTITYSAPHLPVCRNLGAAERAPNAAPDAGYWRKQTRFAVQFGEAIETLARRGVTHAIEIGPHPVLTALVAATPDTRIVSLASLRRGRSDRETLATSVAAVWQDGGTIDWTAYLRPLSPRVVSIPTYPFERERHWLSYARVSATPRVSRGAHPLVGMAVRSPAIDGAVFESHVNVAEQPLLSEHRVHGRAVLPGAAWLDAFATAGRETLDGAWSVRDLTLLAPLDVGDDETRVVQIIVRPENGGHAVSAFSRTDGDDTEWVEHARASLAARSDAPANVTVAVPPDDADATRALYDRFGSIGLTLGPLFHRVTGTARDGSCAHVSVDASMTMQWPAGVMHPVLIDACIQAVALSMPASPEDNDALFMPFAFEQFDCWGTPSEAFVAQATLRSGSATSETVVADVIAVDPSGRVLAQLRGIALKRADARALRWTAEREHLYEMQWEPAPSLSRGAPVSLRDIAARVTQHAPARARETSLEQFGVTGPVIGKVAAMYVWRALRDLAVTLPVGRCFVATTMANELGVLPRHGRQLERLFTILVEDGVLSRQHDAFVVQRLLDDSPLERLRDGLRAQSTPFAGELDIMARCGESLAGALTGRVDPLELLFPGGSLDGAHRIYRDSPFPKAYNAMVRDAVTSLIEQRGTGRPIRILEVGGGTGGTTAAVLDAIPDGQCEYVFTDASALFLSRARERFAHRSDLSFQVLDLEQDLTAQGFGGQTFDLLVGANVIHATRDLAATFARLRPHLAPRSLLLMLEMSHPSRWVDLSFGLTEGWWAFSDRYRTDYPLLAPQLWDRVLSDAGYEEVVVSLGTPADGAGLTEQALILARMPDRAHLDAAGTWVVLADRHGVGQALVAHLERSGAHVVVVPTGDEADGEPHADAASRESVRQLFDGVGADSPILGVLNCWPVNDDGALDAPDTPRRAAHAANSALAVVQALLASSGRTTGSAPRLVFVTRNAVRVDAADAAPDAAQATVWGLARTAQLEHPELGALCVDIEQGTAVSHLHVLAAEALSGDVESQVALRGDSRLVARIDHSARVAPAFPATYRVAPRERGTIEALGIEALELPKAGVGEVLIRVAATGLNFKDVLNTLGQYPGDPGPLGGECSGRVVAVGDRVTDVHVGDEVVTVAGGAMSSHVVVDSRLCAPVPRGVSLENAAALPIAYITAYHSLIETAKLQRGERVLIHAAAGGVGLAAVHLAQRVGAEIFATAGSDDKRAMLRALGVSHVMDSRSTQFAAEIMARTNGEGVHVALNSLSDAFVERTFTATARGGRFVELGKRGIWTAAQVMSLGKDISYHLIDWSDLPRTSPIHIGAMLRTLLADVGSGALPALPVRSFPLSRVAEAFRVMAQGRHTGKLVISHREALDAAGASDVHVVPGAAYIITGGTSGLGLLTAEWLAARGATHLVLCSRSGGDDSTRDAVARLTAGGVRVDVGALDVADAHALGALLDRVRRVSPIRGVIQSAGRLDDGAVLQLDASRMATVFAPKVTGTWNLHALTRSDALDFFICYASVAGALGSAGQANHAAANTFIDALVHHRRASGLPAVSIDWGVWAEIGAAVRTGVVARASGAGLRTLSPDDGMRIVGGVLDGSAAQVIALPVDWNVFLSARSALVPPTFARVARRRAPLRVSAAPAATTTGVPGGTSLVQELGDAVPARRPTVLRSYLRTRVAKTLGLGDGGMVDDRQPLRDAGLDSLLAIELRNVLGTAIGRTLPATLLFDYPTINDLSAYLLVTLFPGSMDPPVPEVAAPVETSATLVDDLSAMSDDDVERLFAAKMRDKS